jgi:ribosomal protein L11 methyltransferase
VLVERFPEGFEERAADGGIELAVYTDAVGERVLRQHFHVVTSERVEPGWEERWRTFHRGVHIGPLWVGPPWDVPPAARTTVIIDPGSAFGTGSHPTTRLCLEAIVELPREGGLLDVGCGSGVLAIAAARLGFAPVAALDVDPNAVAVTKANARANRATLNVIEADALADPLPAAETAIANVTLEVAIGLARRVRSPNLVTCGYLAGDTLRIAGFRHVRRQELDGWALDVWRVQRQ